MSQVNNNKWYAFVPNLLTLSNLMCGVIAIYFAFTGDVKIAIYLMLLGGLFDFFDGFVARLLKVSGELGKQLDSLADLITFGLLPGVMIFSVQRELILEINNGFGQLTILQWIELVSPLMIPVFSALRLAKFNIDTRQTTSFIGLPTPANALFLASLAYTVLYEDQKLADSLSHPLLLTIITIAFALLLVTNLPLFALKFKNYSWKGNEIRYTFLILSLILIVAFRISGFMAIIILYVLLSFFQTLSSKKKSH